MNFKGQVVGTFGASGSGKSYIRCSRYFVDELLPFSDRIIYTNFPLQIKIISQYLCDRNKRRFLLKPRRHPKLAKFCPLVMSQRFKFLPKTVKQSWIDGYGDPWDYFKQVDLNNSYIAIDEIHNFCPSAAKAIYRDKWSKFIGELRHTGSKMELLSQEPGKIAKEVMLELDLKVQIASIENFKEPFSGWLLYDWWNLIAKLGGKYKPLSQLKAFRKNTKSKWEEIGEFTTVFGFEQKYFEFYDSFTETESTGKKGEHEEPEYIRLQGWEFWRWFLGRNFGAILARLLIIIGIIVFLFYMSNRISSTNVKKPSNATVSNIKQKTIVNERKITVNMISSEGVVINNNFYMIGDLIDDTEKKLKAINVKKRLVIFDDDSYLRL